MLTAGKSIVLSSLKYKDYDLIIKCYTNHRGVVSYLQKGALKSKRSKAKAVYFQPLMLLEVEENYIPGRSLQYFKEVSCYNPFKTLHSNIFKASLGVFIAEILAMVLQEEEPSQDLFVFLEASIQYLDVSNDFANFHLLFLLKLSQYLGFYPQDQYKERPFFNLESGTFDNQKSSVYSIEGHQKALWVALMNRDFQSVNSLSLNAVQRRDLLRVVLLYFELHLDSFKKPKSLQVFIDVFH